MKVFPKKYEMNLVSLKLVNDTDSFIILGRNALYRSRTLMSDGESNYCKILTCQQPVNVLGCLPMDNT